MGMSCGFHRTVIGELKLFLILVGIRVLGRLRPRGYLMTSLSTFYLGVLEGMTHVTRSGSKMSTIEETGTHNKA